MKLVESTADAGHPPVQEELILASEVSAEELPALLEALLLVAPEPAPLRDLAEATGFSVAAIDAALNAMQRDTTRGWVIIRHKQTAHLASAPRFASQVRRFLRLERQAKLSGAALEELLP